MAEVEHYVDPKGGKKHSRFDEIAGIELVLLIGILSWLAAPMSKSWLSARL
jgi:hypothetical protein